MQLPRASNASGISVFLITLSLFSAGAAWGMAEVESRAHQGGAWNNQADAPENASLDILKKLEFLQQEVQELRGKVEEQTYKLGQVQEHQKKLYMDLDKRLRDGPNAKTLSATTIPAEQENLNPAKPLGEPGLSNEFVTMQPDVGTTPISAVPTSEDFASEEKAYQNAYRLIQNKDFDGALTGFKSMIQHYPKGKYAPNAQYWLGEIYLVKGSLDLAAQSFDIVYRQYPKHPKAADSLLKLGYVEYGKGQWKRSQELLNEVKNQFPGTTSAQLADSRLQKMRQEGHL